MARKKHVVISFRHQKLAPGTPDSTLLIPSAFHKPVAAPRPGFESTCWYFMALWFDMVLNWLVVSTYLKNISQNGNLPQVGVKIKMLNCLFWNPKKFPATFCEEIKFPSRISKAGFLKVFLVCGV